jgi:non-heme chloroperoxidase
MTYVKTADGNSLYAKQWGPPDGKPVILIHGWPLNADSWDDVALGLAHNGFRAIAYDRRGFGRSDQPWNGYDYDTLSIDLSSIIDHFSDGQKVALVGFSMGGGEVARYLGRYGADRVSHAVLISSVLPYLARLDDNADGVDQSVFDGIMEKLEEDRPGFLQTFAKQFYGVGLLDRPVSQGVLDASFQMAMMAGQWPTVACAKAFASTDFRGDMAAFTVPTLIIHGTSDKTVPIDNSSRRAATMIRDARVVEYDGEPHGLLVTKKVDVIADVTAFLTDSNERMGDDRARGFPEPMLTAPIV